MQDKDQKLIWEKYQTNFHEGMMNIPTKDLNYREKILLQKHAQDKEKKEREILAKMAQADDAETKKIRNDIPGWQELADKKKQIEEDDQQPTGWTSEGYDEPGTFTAEMVHYPDVVDNTRFEEEYLGEFPQATELYNSMAPEYDEYDEGPEAFVVVTLGVKDNDDAIVLIPDTKKGFYCEDGSKNCYPISDQDAKTLLGSEVTYIYDYARAKAENNPEKYSKTVSIPDEIAKVRQQIMADYYTDGSVWTLKNNYYKYGGPNRDAGAWDPSDFR